MMKKLCVLALLFISCSCFSQDLTGIWRGYFYAEFNGYKDYYKYEVQINQLKNNSLEGVTYSYRTTVFYGKATFKGIWFSKTGDAIVKELDLIETKMADNTQACAMTCDLNYSVDSGKEMLTGTFTSINTTTKRDCGSGTVFLQRVQESDFGKEDFLLKKKPAAPQKQNNQLNKIPKDTVKAKPATPDVSNINAKKIQAALGVTPDGIIGSKTMAQLKIKAPGFNEKLDLSNTDQTNRLINQIKQYKPTVKKAAPHIVQPQNKQQQPPAIKKDTIAITSPQQNQQQEIIQPKKIIAIPDVIKSRSNPLVKTINTSAQDIKIELYDNGEIDGDTITVYDNNEVIAYKKGLTSKPITLNIKADANTPTHEFVMVADNLGSIPPNTALMIITTGGKRYQLFITSDKQKNAKVVVQYDANAQ